MQILAQYVQFLAEKNPKHLMLPCFMTNFKIETEQTGPVNDLV